MWSTDYEDLFLAIRMNSVHMSRIHKKDYFKIKSQSNYFRIPTIVFSAMASVIAVGAEPYINQQNISGLVCLKEYLKKFYGEYINLFEKSSLTGINYKDKLLGITRAGKLLGSAGSTIDSDNQSSTSSQTGSPLNQAFEEQL